VPVVVRSDKAPASDVKMTKVSILCKQSSFEVLKTAMEEIGVTGMTVSQVLGCGMQKGPDPRFLPRGSHADRKSP